MAGPDRAAHQAGPPRAAAGHHGAVGDAGDDGALADGRLSWPQVEGIVAAVRRLSAARRLEVDASIAGWLERDAACEPDELVGRVFDRADALAPAATQRAEKRAEDDEFVALLPELFGGGALFTTACGAAATCHVSMRALADRREAFDHGRGGLTA